MLRKIKIQTRNSEELKKVTDFLASQTVTETSVVSGEVITRPADITTAHDILDMCLESKLDWSLDSFEIAKQMGLS